MKKTVLIILLLSFITAFLRAEEPEKQTKESFGYFDFGASALTYPFFLFPGVDFGYRKQVNSLGFDVSIGLNSWAVVNELHGSAVLHYFPHPDLQGEYYVGLGADVGHWFLLHLSAGTVIAPKFVFGRKFRNDNEKNRFWQVSLLCPNCVTGYNKYVHNYPVVEFKYGLGF